MKGQPIIADFGFAVHLDNKSLNKVNAGSPLYMSPQALKYLDFSKDSDIFSLGIIIYEMLHGKTPWSAISEKQLLANILKFKPKIKLKNQMFEQLLLKCLQINKQKRAKFSEILSFFCEQSSLKQPIKPLLQLTHRIPSLTQSTTLKPLKYSGSFLPLKANQNILNQTKIQIKTNRHSGDQQRHKRTQSTIQEQCKTRRHKSEKLDQDFRVVLNRLNPQQLRFLPSSMVQKFKFILDCYISLLSKTQPCKVPNGLITDKIATEILSCKQQGQFCSLISVYVGRMYRLSRTYKHSNCIKDIQKLYERVQTLSN